MRGRKRCLVLPAAFFMTAPVAAQTCPDNVNPPCSEPIEICPIPQMRVHVDFPVFYRARTNWETCSGSKLWTVIEGPPEFDLDGAGGLFYWTPASVPSPDGIENITIRLRNTNGENVDEVFQTFQAVVDDNTIASPVWREYVSLKESVPVLGRATDTLDGGDFVSYQLEFAQVEQSDRPPADDQWVAIGALVTTPVDTPGPLGVWDISSEPDGGRYYLRLVVNLADGTQSIVENQVILDRTATPEWPKRVQAISHSPLLADINDDGRSEVIVMSHGFLRVWDIDGNLLWEASPFGAVFSAPAVGDIDGDRSPEIVATSIGRLSVYSADGTLLPGFPLDPPQNHKFHATPTLADLDQDGRLEIIMVAGGNTRDTPAQTWVYKYDTNTNSVGVMAGWPQDMVGSKSSASASVADLDGDGSLEIIVENFDRALAPDDTTTSRAFAWHADGTPVAGWEGGVVLEVAVAQGTSNGGGGSESLSQPAIADLTGDGLLEIVIASNILQSNGVQIFSDRSFFNAKSAAIGQMDDDPTTLEIVLGEEGWRFDTSTQSFVDLGAVPTWPPLSSAIIGDCGEGHPDIVAGSVFLSVTNITAYHATGEDAGELFSGYPKSTFGQTGDVSAPVIGDFNGDGRVQVAATFTDASYGGVVALWDMPGENHDEHHDWPMLGHNIRRTGTYSDPMPNRPSNLTQERIGSSVILGWTDRSDVEEHYVIQRSSTGDPWSYDTFATLPADSTQFVVEETPSCFYRVRALRYDTRTGESILSRFAAAIVTDGDGDGVPDICDACPGGDDSLDSDGDGVPNECDVCAGGDDTIDTDGDGVPDDCDLCPGVDDTSVDSDSDGVPDGCDICPGGDDTLDTDGDGVPDDCDICNNNFPEACTFATPILASPPHDILKNRYISIDPRGAADINVGMTFDIRVELVSTLVNGVTGVGSHWWASPPDASCISVVTTSQPTIPPKWDACPTLHLTGCPVIPTSTYEIVAVVGGLQSGPSLAADTQAKPGIKWWGDCVGNFNGTEWTAPNGTTNADDFVAAIKTFQDPNGFNAAHVSVTDLEPAINGSQINRIVNINDVFSTILGFQGQEYPGPEIDLCPDP